MEQVDSPLRAELMCTALDASSNDALAHIIANRLNHEVATDDGIIKFLLLFTAGDDESFLLALQKSQVLRKLISLLSSLPWKYMQGPDVTVYGLCTNVVRIVESGNAITGLHKALRLGFLQAYLACRDTLLPENLESDKEYVNSVAKLANQIRTLVEAQILDPHIFRTTKKVFAEINETPALLRSHKKLIQGSDILSKLWINMHNAFDLVRKAVRDDRVFFRYQKSEKSALEDPRRQPVRVVSNSRSVFGAIAYFTAVELAKEWTPNSTNISAIFLLRSW
ncbi:hypothetical protein DL96DRAFT_1717901 [Flagelloscypha sp. PMI_526]|nr:hypothetical protein DL96DRAFT_1717901 [Flagelloscypha sp. PMI_526]